MKKSIDRRLPLPKRRRDRIAAMRRQLISRRVLRHENLEARQLLDANSLTFVLDFVESSQGQLLDSNGNAVAPFDASGFGFSTGNENAIAAEVLDQVRAGLLSIPDAGDNPLSPLPDGQELDVDILIGDIGNLPSNGASEYYVLLIGNTVGGVPTGVVGTTQQDAVRDAIGNIGPAQVGTAIGSIYTDNIDDTLIGITPSNALASGNLDYSSNTISNFVLHEIGQVLSLTDVESTTATTLRGLPPMMGVVGTNPTDAAPENYLSAREFALSATSIESTGSTVSPLQTLINNLGTRDVVGLPDSNNVVAGPQLIGINPNAGSLFADTFDIGSVGTPSIPDRNRLDVAPKELKLRFASDAPLDSSTLSSGIKITRSVNGVFGDGDDIEITPGYLGLDDSQHVVIARFSESLPDDSYRVRVFGFDDPLRGVQGLRSIALGPNVGGALFEPATVLGNEVDGVNDDIETLYFELDLGAQVIAIVPQPIARSSVADPLQGVQIGDLVQMKQQIVVYFNDDDLAPSAVTTTGSPSDPTVVQPTFYKLILTNDTVTNNDDVVVLPTVVEYDPALDRAVLTFLMDQNGNGIDSLSDIATAAGVSGGDATFRLRVGDDEAVATVDTPVTPETVIPQSIELFGSASSIALGTASIPGNLIWVSMPGGLGTTTFEFTNAANQSAVAGRGNIPIVITSNDSRATVLSAIATAISSQSALAINAVATQTNVALDTRNGQIVTVSGSALSLSGDVGSYFGDANPTALGIISGATIIRQEIRALSDYPLEFPGGYDEPGLRDTDVQPNLLSPISDVSSGSTSSAISRLYYNFNTAEPYGESGAGQLLYNAITEEQKQRAREVFHALGDQWGIDFVETESHRVNGVDGVSLTVVTGDLVVLNSTGVESAPGGVYGSVTNTPESDQQANTFGRTLVLMDSGESWFNGLSFPEPTEVTRLSYYAHVASLIMKALGVGSASEAPPGTLGSGVISNITLGGEERLLAGVDYTAGGATILTGVNPVEPMLPGDVDTVRGQHIFRPESRDVDVYRFEVPAGQTGTFTAQTFAQRLNGSASLLDSYLSIYRETASGKQELIARNDDYFGNDSFVQLPLSGGTYFLAVSASGNEDFDLTVPDSGMGGTSEGKYELFVNFEPDTDAQIVDTTGTPIDGDGDGIAGGQFDFWFRSVTDVGHIIGQTPTRPRTLFVDKAANTNMSPGIVVGTPANPYNNIQKAFADARSGDVVRIVSNGGLDGNVTTLGDNYAFEVGRGGAQNLPLSDGAVMQVPKGVSVQIDAGVLFKLKSSEIVVGSISSSIDRSDGSLQVLGTPYHDLRDQAGNPIVGAIDGVRLLPMDASAIIGMGDGEVRFTSYDDESKGTDTNPLHTTPVNGNWGGIEFRNDVDNAEGRSELERQGIFLNYVGQADFQYGGGQVIVNSQSRTVNPIHMTASRPTLLYNEISRSADAAMSADGDSFEETTFDAPFFQRNNPFVADYGRVGPAIRGNYIHDNSTNGLFVRVDTQAGQATQKLSVPARWDDTDIVHIVGENLTIQGQPGGPILQQIRPPATGIVPSVTSNPSSTLNTSTTAVSYNYRFTFVDRFGGESLPSDPTPLVSVVAGQQVLLSNVPTATGDFISRRIYRSGPGGTGSYELISELDRSSANFVDHGQSLGAQLNAISISAIPDATSSLAAGTYHYRVGVYSIDSLFGAAEAIFDDDLYIDVAAGESVRFENLPGVETSRSQISTFGGALSYWRLIYRENPITGDYDLAGFQSFAESTFVDNGGVDNTGTVTGSLLPDLPVVSSTTLRARPNARLSIDPSIVVKVEGSRIETGYGAQFIAEGSDGNPVVITSTSDDRYGAGGVFDTNGDAASSAPAPGDWGGVHIGPFGSVSIDQAILSFGGGVTETGGTFAGFNVLEIIQSEARVANSIFEYNASGLGGQASDQRDGHGFNEPAVIFVRGSQPVLVDNIIQNNNESGTAAISINVSALNSEIVLDHGRQTGMADRRADIQANFGPLVDSNRLGGNAINGMAVRGGTLTTESVWDDTDIVHVVDNFRADMQGGPEIIRVPDLYTYGGLRLQSSSSESLVVKFGSGAEILASGRPLDIEDRVGGTVHVLGAPGFPVVLTSLNDDSVGAGFDARGQAQYDTNGNGTNSSAAPGDWQGIVLDKFSNDRNVETINESESPNVTLRPDNALNNADPRNAQYLGDLATSESTSDDNLRLGFDVHGVISRPSDVDVYSFNAKAGTEVWIDIDRTSVSLDSILELVNIDGEILALSDNSHAESAQITTLLTNPNLLPSNKVNVLQRDPFGATNDIDGSFRDDYTTNIRDAGMRVVLPGSVGSSNTYFIRVRSNNQLPGSTTGRDLVNDQFDGLPYENDLLANGKTSGLYQLQVRIGELNEHGGSTVRQAEIRYATTAIQVSGLPIHSPLLGEATENMVATSDGNDLPAGAVDLGTINATDRAALSVAGQLFDQSGGLRTDDVDWYAFNLQPDSVDPAISNRIHTPIIIDVDHADGLARPDTTVWLFGYLENNIANQQMRLLAVGTDSNVIDDQPGPKQGVDQDDFSRGSAGPLDAWLGTMELTGGRYLIAITNNSRVSDQMEQFQIANPRNPLARLEPLSSVQRISTDVDFDDDGVPDNYFIDSYGNATAFPGATTDTAPITVAFDGNNNRIDYTLSDVVLYVTNGSTLYTVNPFTGAQESVVSDSRIGNTGYNVRDLAMRPDGNLYGFSDTFGYYIDGNSGHLLQLATEGGNPRVAGNAGILTYEVNPADGKAQRALSNSQPGNNPRNGDGLSFEAMTFIGSSGNTAQLGANTKDLALISVAYRPDYYVAPEHDTNWIFFHNPSTGDGISSFNGLGDRANADGVVGGPGYESGTTVRERGYIDTNVDNYANTQSAVLTLDPNSFIFDGNTIGIDSTTSTATIEFDEGLTLGFDLSASPIADGDVVQITDSLGALHALEIDTGRVLNVLPLDSITRVTDGDTISLRTQSGFPLTFEFDNNGSLADGNAIAIKFDATMNNVAIANRIASAINGLRLAGLSAKSQNASVAIEGDSMLQFSSSALISSGDYGVTTAGAVAVKVSPFATATELAAVFADLDPVNFGYRLGLAADGNELVIAGATAVNVITPTATWLVPGTPQSLESSIRFDTTLGSLQDNDTFTVSDGFGFSRDVTLDTGESILISDPSLIADGDWFTLSFYDQFFGYRNVEFEFNDRNVAAAVSANRNEIDITGNTAFPLTPADIAGRIADVVNTGGFLNGPLEPGLSATSSLFSSVVDFQGDNLYNFGNLTVNSPGLTVIGDYGRAGLYSSNLIDIPYHSVGSQIAAAAAAQLTSNGVLEAQANGNVLSIAYATGITVTTPTATYMVPQPSGSLAGVTSGNLPLARIAGETTDETALRIAALINDLDLNADAVDDFAVKANGSKLVAYKGYFDHSLTSSVFIVNNTPGGGRISGITGVETDVQTSGFDRVELFAVSEEGDLFRVVSGSSFSSFKSPFQLGSSNNRGDYIATLTDENGDRIPFSGLTVGPRNLDLQSSAFGVSSGRLSDTLFGISNDGRIYAFDLEGRPAPVFVNGQSVINTGQYNATGLAFSNLDVNLWHVSNDNTGFGGLPEVQDGYGIELAPDGNQFRYTENGGDGNNHLYFGFENPRSAGSDIQTGVWTGVYDIGDNRPNVGVVDDYAGDYLTYNFPGGALGSMESNPLDLSQYSSADRPTLYFNYYLETENANDDLGGNQSDNRNDWMLDSFRVFAAGEDGIWHLMATNNSDRAGGLAGQPDGYDINLNLNPPQPSALNSGGSDEYDQGASGGTKLVQELFDVGDNGAPTNWRQARIFLDDFAGQEGVRIRFDFSTAGSMALGDPTLGGEELRAVAGSKITDGQTMVMYTQSSFFVGAEHRFEFDSGLELRVPGAANIPSGEFLQIDGTKITFVQGGTEVVGDSVVNYDLTDPAEDIASRLVAELLDAGLQVYQDPVQGNRLNVLQTQVARASAGLPATEISLKVPSGNSFNFNGGDYLQLDNERIEFVAGGAEVPGDGFVNFNYGTSAASITQLLRAELEAVGFTVKPGVLSDQLKVYGAAGASASSSLPDTFLTTKLGFIAGLPGVADGNTPILVHSAMTANEVALAVQTSLAMGLNEDPAQDVVDTYPIRNGYLIKVYGNDITDPGPLGLTRHGSEEDSPFRYEDSYPGDEFGQFTSSRVDYAFRAQNNQHRGVYVDDIIIGFRERGEMVINGGQNQLTFVDNLEYEPLLNYGIISETDLGFYQVEIRTAADYGRDFGDGTVHDLYVNRTFDTNDRLATGVTLNAPEPERVYDGQTFTLSDGTNTVTFEFDDVNLASTNPSKGVAPGHVRIPFSTAGDMTRSQLGRNIRDAINSSQAQSQFRVSAAMTDGSVTGTSTALGSVSNSYQIALHGLVAVDNFGSKDFADLNNYTPSSSNPFSSVSGRKDDYVLHGIDEFASIDGGDRNRVRDQGQILLQNNIITDALLYGINVIPGDRNSNILSDLAGVLPHAGPPQATQEYNDERLTPGVTIVNNIVVGSGQAGIRVAGDRGTDGAVPMARIVNNTVYGGTTNGTAPTTPPVSYGGVNFPAGYVSFADAVLSYDPNAGGGPAPTDAGASDPARALGAPDAIGATTAAQGATALGSGGRLVLQFTDNLLTGSGDNRPDLVVFEVGSVFEDVLVEISSDGNLWTSVGKVSATTSTIDIDAFGFGTTARIGYVRLTDDPNQGGATQPYAGAKIDAVGAISAVSTLSGTGVGIQVRDNAGPTLSNNIVANVATGIDVDVSSEATTEVSSTLYYQVANPSNYRGGDLGTSSIVVQNTNAAVFVDAANRNFYLAQNSPAIDSSREAINDRSYMLTIKGPLGIGASPILAPDRDVTGQLRVDDPNSTSQGTGQNVFKDIGAFERSDFVGPEATLVTPRDNDSAGLDVDPNDTYVQLLSGSLNQFEILISDVNGTGPNASTIIPGDALSNPSDPAAMAVLNSVSITENGRLLVEGVDYSIGFSSSNGTILLTPLTGIWRPESIYEITLNNSDRLVISAPSGSSVTDGDQFTIVDENDVEAVFEYDSGYVVVVPQTFTIVVPRNGGSSVPDGESFTIYDSGLSRTFELTNDNNFNIINIPIAYDVTDSASALRDKILAVIASQSFGANINPVAVGTDQIQIGNSPALGLTTQGDENSGLTQQGVASGVRDGDTFSITDVNGRLTTFEFDDPSNPDAPVDHVSIEISITDTNEQIAAALAQAVRGASVGMDTARNLGQGVVQLGGTVDDKLVTTGSALAAIGRPGTESGLQLTIPSAAIGTPLIIDGTTFSITRDGQQVVFEFNNVDVDPATQTGVQVIQLTAPMSGGFNRPLTVPELAVEIANTIAGSSIGLTPTVDANNVIVLNEPLNTEVDVQTSGLQLSGVPGGAIPVSFSPLNFSSSQMALEIVRAINGVDLPVDPNDGPFAGLASIRGSESLFLRGVKSVDDPSGLLSVAQVQAIRDIAGNPLQPNRPNSETQFTILTSGLKLDFGDAPVEAYLNDNGARHVIIPGSVQLGPSPITAENDALVNSTATGDAGDDGVNFDRAFFNPYVTNSVIEVSVLGAGVLDGWVDFNRDGDFDDLGEQVVSNRPVSQGTEFIALTPPASNFVPGVTYARFRVSLTGASSTGLAAGGEVEDYLVTNLAGFPPEVGGNGTDFYQTNEDTPLLVPASQGLLANDTDVDGDPLSIFDPDNQGFPRQIPIRGGLAGMVTLNRDGSFTYEPAANYNGTDYFTYRAFDGELPSNEVSTVTLVVKPVNDPPVAKDDPDPSTGLSAYQYLEDTVVHIPWNVLLANDGGVPPNEFENLIISFAEGISPTVDATTNVPVTVVIDSVAKELIVTPQQHGVGTAKFIYYVTDDGLTDGQPDPLQSATAATVTLEFLKVNDPPVTNELAHEDLGLTVNEDGTVILSDSTVLTNQPLVIDVTAILSEDAPAPNRVNNFDIYELTNQEVALQSVQYDTENGGTAVYDSATNTILYNPPKDFFGTDAIFYTISDVDLVPPIVNPNGVPQSYVPNGSGGYRLVDDPLSTTGRITLTILPINDPPIATNPHGETLEDTTTSFTNMLTRFAISAGPGESESVSVSDGGNSQSQQGGTFSIQDVPGGEPTLMYTPPANFFGDDIVSIQVTDAQSASTTVDLTITVRPVNDAPYDPTLGSPAVFNAIEDSLVSIDLGPLVAGGRVNESGTDETLSTAGNIPQSLQVLSVRLAQPAPVGATATLQSDGHVRVTLPNNYFTERDLTTSLLPPLGLIYTVTDGGYSFIESSPGVFTNTYDPKTLDIPFEIKVYPVNDQPVGKVHRIKAKTNDGVPRVLEDTPYQFNVALASVTAEVGLIATDALVASMSVGTILPPRLDSAGTGEDLGGNNTKDTADELLSQHLFVLPVNATLGSNVSTQFATDRGGLVEFIDTDGDLSNGFEALRYEPPSNFASLTEADYDSFTYQIRDDGVSYSLDANGNPVEVSDPKSAVGTVQIEVLPVNDPPQFFIPPDTVVNVNEDTLLYDANNSGHVNLPGFVQSVRPGPSDAIDEVGQSVRFVIQTNNPGLFEQITVGEAGNELQVPDISIAPDGTLDFNLQLNQNGQAVVTVVAVDDSAVNPQSSPPQTFTISVAPVNDPPEFGYPNAPGAPATIFVSEDSGFYLDPDWASPVRPGPISALDEQKQQGVSFQVSTDRPDLFTLVPSITSTGALRFTPAPNKTGVATVNVYAVDTGLSTSPNSNQSSTVSFKIDIGGTNDNPVAVNDTYVASENAVLQISSPGVLANDTDLDGDTLFVSGLGSVGTFTGLSALGATVTFTLNSAQRATGGFTYDPTTSETLDKLVNGQSLVDSFSYTLVDSAGASALSQGRVSITVAGVNDAPRLVQQSVLVGSDRSTDIDVTKLVEDPDSRIDPSSVFIAGSPFNGTLVNNNDGTVRYTPRAGFTGSDSFRFSIADAQGNRSLEMLIQLLVTDSPLAGVDTAFTTVGKAVDIDVLANDTGVSAPLNPNSVNITRFPAYGTAEVLPNGFIRFTPVAGFVGSAQLRYTVSDVNGLVSQPTLVIITVGNSAGQNPSNHNDVNNSGEVSPIDALIVINLLSSRGVSSVNDLVSAGVITSNGPFYDVNGNGIVEPLDSLLVLNYLNGLQGSIAGEASEFTSAAFPAPDVSNVQIGAAPWMSQSSYQPEELAEETTTVLAIDSVLNEYTDHADTMIMPAIDQLASHDKDDSVEEIADEFWLEYLQDN